MVLPLKMMICVDDDVGGGGGCGADRPTCCCVVPHSGGRRICRNSLTGFFPRVVHWYLCARKTNVLSSSSSSSTSSSYFRRSPSCVIEEPAPVMYATHGACKRHAAYYSNSHNNHSLGRLFGVIEMRWFVYLNECMHVFHILVFFLLQTVQFVQEKIQKYLQIIAQLLRFADVRDDVFSHIQNKYYTMNRNVWMSPLVWLKKYHQDKHW